MSAHVKHLLTLIVTCALAYAVAAQQVEKLIIPPMEGETGQLIAVPVKVTGFKSITSCQFSVSWDPAELEFISVGSYALTGVELNETQLGNAKIGLSWQDQVTPGVTGFTLADSTNFARLTFKILKTSGKTRLEFGDVPMPIEWADAASNAILPDVFDGEITVGTTTNASGSPASFSLPRVVPNPFHEQTNLQYHLPEATLVRLRIYNRIGLLVYSLDQRQSAGLQSISLDQEKIPLPGLYYFDIQMGTSSVKGELQRL